MFLVKFILIVVALTLSFAHETKYCWAEEPNSPDPQVVWKRLADKLDLGIARLPAPLLPGEVTLLRASPEHYSPRVIRSKDFGRARASVSWLAKTSSMPICINASFFDPEGNPLGLVVSRGIQHSKLHRGGSTLTGIFLAFKDSYQILQREELKESYGLEAIQAGPRLVVNRKIASGLDPKGPASRRSGICLNDKNQLIIFAITSALRGATLHEMANLLITPEINCQDSLNLDGGGSSQLYISKDISGVVPDFQGVELTGRDDVPVALCLAKK